MGMTLGGERGWEGAVILNSSNRYQTRRTVDSHKTEDLESAVK